MHPRRQAMYEVLCACVCEYVCRRGDDGGKGGRTTHGSVATGEAVGGLAWLTTAGARSQYKPPPNPHKHLGASPEGEWGRVGHRTLVKGRVGHRTLVKGRVGHRTLVKERDALCTWLLQSSSAHHHNRSSERREREGSYGQAGRVRTLQSAIRSHVGRAEYSCGQALPTYNGSADGHDPTPNLQRV